MEGQQTLLSAVESAAPAPLLSTGQGTPQSHGISQALPNQGVHQKHRLARPTAHSDHVAFTHPPEYALFAQTLVPPSFIRLKKVLPCILVHGPLRISRFALSNQLLGLATLLLQADVLGET